MRYALHLSYFGKNYAGWQRQDNAHSVQEEIEKALSVLLKCKIDITGCGRTDTGVHAVNFYAHFDYNNALPDNLGYHINAILSKDIVIHSIAEVDKEWHARFSATCRSYRYFIGLKANPFILDLCWNPPYELNTERMKSAAKILLNYNDFTSFARLHGGQKTNICKIIDVILFCKNDVLIIEISADRFLRNMIRAIVGTLVDVGRGFISVERFEEIIQEKNRSAAGASAPARGLFLTEVKYSPELDSSLIKNVEDFPYL